MPRAWNGWTIMNNETIKARMGWVLVSELRGLKWQMPTTHLTYNLPYNLFIFKFIIKLSLAGLYYVVGEFYDYTGLEN